MPGQHERPPPHQNYTNQDTKRRQSKEMDPKAHKTELPSKRNPTGKPLWAWQQSKHQAHTTPSIDKSLSQNHHRVWSLTHRRATKVESKAANRDRADKQTCSPSQHTNATANLPTWPLPKNNTYLFTDINKLTYNFGYKLKLSVYWNSSQHLIYYLRY